MEGGNACFFQQHAITGVATISKDAQLLAGLLTVNDDEAPGRPPGAESEFIVDRRAAASS